MTLTDPSYTDPSYKEPSHADRSRQENTSGAFRVPPAPDAIDAQVWPGVASPPAGIKAQVAGKAADALFRAAVRRLPLRVEYPDGTVLGTGGVRRAGDDHGASGGLRGPDRRQRADRAWRVLHGGGLGSIRPRRRPGGLCLLRGHAHPRAAAEAPQPVPAAGAPPGTQHRAEHPLQHLPPLRPLQRAVRQLPGQHHELLLSALPSIGEASWQRWPGTPWLQRSRPRSTGCWTRPAWGRAPGCWRSAPAGANLPSAPPPAAPPSTTVTLSSEQQELPAQQRGRGRLRRRRHHGTQDYRAVEGEYDAVVSVEMIEAVGYRILAHLLPDHRPGAGPRRQGGHPGHHHAARPDARHPQQPTPGCTSTSSRAGSCRPCGPSRSVTEQHTALRVRERLAMGDHYAATLGCGRSGSWQRVRGSARSRIRRGLPADVAVLPVLLTGRLPVRIPGRAADRPGPPGGAALTRREAQLQFGVCLITAGVPSMLRDPRCCVREHSKGASGGAATRRLRDDTLAFNCG